ncbi:hypothetical protein IEU95_15530 [Hoyosella rhizosphaerae]|uniref:Uncharacterized protein n=1 Tax=Hoyosella rhizosphaerae TaxID=1755582 RepID=A0A916XIS4_9ACTN|nr:hypothetical protein [Hoyosella rhizosphaerae]MBN4928245.1 hypothetical protein [Hoyosella rhizosphaerae]GGC73518.1 hypothetical protein GCM10011410_28320 [Hoyosella rhizosphaerae]
MPDNKMSDNVSQLDNDSAENASVETTVVEEGTPETDTPAADTPGSAIPETVVVPGTGGSVAGSAFAKKYPGSTTNPRVQEMLDEGPQHPRESYGK